MYKLRFLWLGLLLLLASCSTVDAIFGPDEPEVAVAPTTAKIVSDNAKLETEISALRGSLTKLKQDIASKKARKAQAMARMQAERVAKQKAKAAIPEDRLWVTISFRSGYSELTTDSSKALKRLASKFLSKQRKQTLEIRGYTDNEPIGGYAYSRHTPRHPYKTNRALSKARAQSVAHTLIAAGIPRSIVQTRGFGATAFVASNKTDAGRQKNRRSEIHLVNR